MQRVEDSAQTEAMPSEGHSCVPNRQDKKNCSQHLAKTCVGMQPALSRVHTIFEVLNAEKQNEGTILACIGVAQHYCYGIPDRHVPAGRRNGGSDSRGLCAGGGGSAARDRRHGQHCGHLFGLICSSVVSSNFKASASSTLIREEHGQRRGEFVAFVSQGSPSSGQSCVHAGRTAFVRGGLGRRV